MRLFGKPAPPNPPTMICAPSGISATASSRLAHTFFFITRPSPPPCGVAGGALRLHSREAIVPFPCCSNHFSAAPANRIRHPHPFRAGGSDGKSRGHRCAPLRQRVSQNFPCRNATETALEASEELRWCPFHRVTAR